MHTYVGTHNFPIRLFADVFPGGWEHLVLFFPSDPLLAERIRARLRGEPAREPALDWHRLAPLVAEYWRRVLAHVEPRHAAGRLKQWLNLLRRVYPQAEVLYQQLRTVRINDEVARVLSMQTLQQADVVAA